MLCATTAFTFWTSWLPRVLREWVAFNILTSKSASRHKGMQFFISQTASARYFSKPIFRPSGATKHWTNTVLPDFSTIACTCIFFLTLSLLFSDSSHLCIFIHPYCILSEVWLLNFLRQTLVECFGPIHLGSQCREMYNWGAGITTSIG